MADFIQVPPDSTGKKVDAVSMDVGANTVMRQRIVIGDNSATAQFAVVTGGALVCTGTFNISAMPTVTVTGGVAISGTAAVSLPANLGTLNDISRTVQVQIATPFTVNNISATVVVAGVVGLTAGTANIGRINDISATVNVSGVVNISAMPSVVLAAGTANFGTLNDISRTVQVAIGTPFTVNNISATAVVAGVVGLTAGTANIGRINDISATVTIAGVVNISATHSVILAAGTANIGTLNDISRTVNVAVGTPFTVNNISATVTVAGTISLGPSTANIGTINNISAAVVLAAGSNNIGTINNISANVTVVNAAGTANIGAVSLGAGTANIGFINAISATVTVAVTSFTPILKQAVQSRISLSVSALATLASSTYVQTDIYTCNTNKPNDVIVELGVGTTNAPAGNKQVVVFIQESLDGSNFRSGPISGTTTTDEPDLRYLGIVPVNSSSTGITHRGFFSVANTLGFMPYAFQLVIKNDLGVALTTATLVTSEISSVMG